MITQKPMNGFLWNFVTLLCFTDYLITNKIFSQKFIFHCSTLSCYKYTVRVNMTHFFQINQINYAKSWNTLAVNSWIKLFEYPIIYIIKKFKFVIAARHLFETGSEELSSQYEDLISDCYEHMSNES